MSEEKYIAKTNAIITTWMILRGMGYAAEDNPDMVKTVAAVFDTAPAADVVERPRWIPVAERLPEDGDYVLCWHEYYSYSECRMVTDYGLGYQYNGNWGGEASNGHNARVLYWIPLPEPPEGQK